MRKTVQIGLSIILAAGAALMPFTSLNTYAEEYRDEMEIFFDEVEDIPIDGEDELLYDNVLDEGSENIEADIEDTWIYQDEEVLSSQESLLQNETHIEKIDVVNDQVTITYQSGVDTQLFLHFYSDNLEQEPIYSTVLNAFADMNQATTWIDQEKIPEYYIVKATIGMDETDGETAYYEFINPESEIYADQEEIRRAEEEIIFYAQINDRGNVDFYIEIPDGGGTWKLQYPPQ